MKAFNTNCAKSYVGKRVNLHLKNGDTLVNVFVVRVESRFVRCIGASRRSWLVALKDVSYAQDVPVLEVS